MTSLDRRVFLGGLAGAALGLRPPHALGADPIAVSSLALSAVSVVSGMMAGADGLVEELDATHLKLDAIMRNQELLADSINAVDSKISDLMTITLEVPKETIGLGLLVEATDVGKNLFVAGRRLQDGLDDGEYPRRREQFFDLASRIQSTTPHASTPSVAAAAWSAVEALRLIARIDPAGAPDRLRRAITDLRRANEALLSSASTISARVEETRRRIAAKEEEISRVPSARVLPEGYGAVDASRPANEEAVIASPTQCFQGPHGETVADGHSEYQASDADGSYGSNSVHVYWTWYRWTTEWRRVPIVVRRRTAFGGRPAVWVTAEPIESWASGAATRERHDPGPTVAKQRDRNVAGWENVVDCIDSAPEADGVPGDLKVLRGMLETRNELVAVESGLLAHLDRCRIGLSRLDKTEKALFG